MSTARPDQEDSGGISAARSLLRKSGSDLPKRAFERSALLIFLSAATPFVYLAAAMMTFRLELGPVPLRLLGSFLLLLAAQRAFQTLVHDSSHRFFSSRIQFNDRLADYICAGWIGSTVAAYRDVHMRHHQYNGSAADPERVDATSVRAKGGTLQFILSYIVCRESGRLLRRYYGGPSTDSGTQAKGNRTTLTKARNALDFAARTMRGKSHIIITQTGLLAAFSLFAHAPALYILWLYLAMSWSPMLSGLRFVVEHPGPTDLTVTTRSPLLERIFFAPFNFNYHFEHHLWPSLPPYRLKSGHRHLAALRYFERHPTSLADGFVRSLKQKAI